MINNGISKLTFSLCVGVIATVACAATSMNLALNKPTTPAEKSVMVDGDYSNGFRFGSGGSFAIDLGVPTEVNRVVFVAQVCHCWTNFYVLSSSNDGVTWSEILRKPSVAWMQFEFEFPPATARYFKAEFPGYGNGYDPSGASVNIQEVELYSPSYSSTNLALGKHVTSNFIAEDKIQSITNGDIGSSPEDRIDLTKGKDTAITIIDLGKVYTVNRIRSHGGVHTVTLQFSFEVSTDSVHWTEVMSKNIPSWDNTHIEPSYDSYASHSFAAQKARYIKNIIPHPQTSTSGDGTQLWEIQVFGPADQTTGLSRTNKSIGKLEKANLVKSAFGTKYNLAGRKLISTHTTFIGYVSPQ